MKPETIKSKNDWNIKSSHRANKYMLKYHNRNTRTRWEISSMLTSDIRMTSLTSFWCLYFMMSLHISHLIIMSLLLILIRKVFGRIPCYESPSTPEQNDVIALLSFRTYFIPCSSASIVNSEHAFNCQLLYFSRFYIKINSIYIFYSFLVMIYTKWNAHPIASSSK